MAEPPLHGGFGRSLSPGHPLPVIRMGDALPCGGPVHVGYSSILGMLRGHEMHYKLHVLIAHRRVSIHPPLDVVAMFILSQRWHL